MTSGKSSCFPVSRFHFCSPHPPSPSRASLTPPATRRHCRNGPHAAGSGALLGPAAPSLVGGQVARNRKCRSQWSRRSRRCRPFLTAAFTAWVTTGTVSEEVAAAGSGVEAARHEAAQARTVARVGTVRAGPGGRCSIRPLSFLFAR